MPELTKNLAQFCEEITFESVPEEVTERTKDLLLDCLGVTLRSSTIPSSRTIVAATSGLSAAGDATVWGTDLHMTPQYAALANGTAAHGLEMDDVTSESSLHPGVVAFPTAMAIAEELGSEPKEVIAAVIAGYEVIMRLGEATMNPEGNYSLGFHSTGTCGVFGATVIAGKLIGLDAEGLTNALGIAGSMASGSMEYLTDGAWTKRLHPGWAAHNGILAAHLAKERFLGPKTILEGPFGFLNAYTRKATPNKILENLGSPYKVMEANVKIHACCRYMHAPIDAALQLIEKQGITAADVQRVRVSVPRAGFDVVAEPLGKKREPANVVEAQFSIPFAIAVSFVRGQAGFDEFSQENVEDSAIKEMMQKVEPYVDDALDQTYPRQWQAQLTTELKDGGELSAHIVHPHGGWPGEAITRNEIVEKFMKLAPPSADTEILQEIVANTRRFEKLSGASGITALLAKPSTPSPADVAFGVSHKN